LVPGCSALYETRAGTVFIVWLDPRLLASAVIYTDRTMRIGTWGSEVSMTPDVVSVRQNMTLLIDNGVVNPANPRSHTRRGVLPGREGPPQTGRRWE
jgi:hypothetical protein